ncbi:S24 family peptidase [Herbidospora mongoliensis]|uniref:S24 family peptidase n=1 Tax=Herbidospora mongoliensis TaxID=688067 RepID=UPI00082D7BF9|nr:S24 family peptidase [Herbidospora mongoliensis]
MFTSVRVSGDSMLPVLRPGDCLVVRRGAEIRPGDVVIARIPGNIIVKRVFRWTDEGWWLESDNQRAPGRKDSWDFGAIPPERIIGKVVGRYWPWLAFGTRFLAR